MQAFILAGGFATRLWPLTETNLPWLFTFEHYPHLRLPNTTNSLEGSFTHIKKKIALHSGLRIDRKQKLIQELLRGK